MRFGLFQFEALAVSALNLSGVGLMGAHLNGVQTAVLVVLAVMSTVVYSCLLYTSETGPAERLALFLRFVEEGRIFTALFRVILKH